MSIGSNTLFAAPNQCQVQSGPARAPVLELFTSEGCSSCPPADRWLSRLRAAQAASGNGVAAAAPVIQAFHVGYWDYIGWADRFATQAHTLKQREVAARNRLRSIYTPQLVLDGRDWPQWHNASTVTGTPPRLQVSATPAGAQITLRQTTPDEFEASVTVPLPRQFASTTDSTTEPATDWAAYWTVTEHGHSSRVKAGENAGELLQHDFVVRQYVPVGQYRTAPGVPRTLKLRSIAATPGHPRQINLVVFDPASGATLQAVALGC